MTINYYNYDTQKWENDLPGFVKFHSLELDYYTQFKDLENNIISKIKHHANMLIQAGKKSELSDYVIELLSR